MYFAGIAGDLRMTKFGDYETADFWAASGWIAPWLRNVDRAYWREMIDCIGENWIRRPDWKEYVLSEAGRQTLRLQLCTRISQASEVFVPWLAQAVNLDGKRILEIGCGSGSSTAALARAGANVLGVDIKGPSLDMARKRIQLLGFAADFLEAPPTWLQTEVAFQGFAGSYDLIVCYAMLEHLLVSERLNLLTMCRRLMERDGAVLAIFETPNRFAPFDWHTSKLAFADILPDELAYEFAKSRSPRRDHPAKRHAEMTPSAVEAIYRFGRGVSWHEFELTFGLGNLEVLLDGYSPRSKHQANYKSSDAYEAALADIFAQLEPSVPRGFCRPSLELLLRLRESHGSS
jgi:2-polyprenyl-3-methyl-5-hydroxy-6-metoxy-1,4-benzoquinol methylase